MSRKQNIKSFGLGSLEIKSASEGLIRAKFSTFNVVDHDGDITLPGAFKVGAPVRLSAYNHSSWGNALPIGKGIIGVENDYAYFDGQFFMNTTAGRESFETVKAMGDLQQFSYGFDVLETGELTPELRGLGARRILKSLDVFEISPVLLGAGIGTETMSLKSASDAAEIKRVDEERLESERAEAAARATARAEFVKFQKTRMRLTIGEAIR